MSQPAPPFSFGTPQNHQFAEFLYIPNVLLPHEIDQVTNLWKADQAANAGVSGEGNAIKDDLRKTSIFGLENIPEHRFLYEKLAMYAVQCNTERYGFDVHGFMEPLQLMTYGHDDFFDWHLDFGVGVNSGRKLSMTIQLSDADEYEGGELQFMINQNVVSAPKDKGTMIVFPSFILHRVNPITAGTRKSIVGWVGGPPYR